MKQYAEALFTHGFFRDLVRWPRWEPAIRILPRIPVSRTKSVWNLCRRLRARTRETFGRVTGKPARPE